MINETIQRLINPAGPGYRIISALAPLGESADGRPRAVRLAALAVEAALPEDMVRGLVDEMASAEILRTAEGYVWLAWSGHYWMQELEAQRLLGVAHLLKVPVVGVTNHEKGHQPTISLTFEVGSMWELIDAVERGIAASGPADKERLAAMKLALERHQDQLLLVTEGAASPGSYTVITAEVPAEFSMQVSTPAGTC